MSKYERELEQACHCAATDLGLVGQFKKNNPHHSFQMVLPDASVVKVSFASTPRNPSMTLVDVGKKIKKALMRNLQQRNAT